MPEQNNDRLEQFFRKAATKADIPFDEQHWKKLEARLDAANAGGASLKNKGRNITAAVVVGALLLLSTAVWVNSRYAIVSPPPSEVSSQNLPQAEEGPGAANSDPMPQPEITDASRPALKGLQTPAADEQGSVRDFQQPENARQEFPIPGATSSRTTDELVVTTEADGAATESTTIDDEIKSTADDDEIKSTKDEEKNALDPEVGRLSLSSDDENIAIDEENIGKETKDEENIAKENTARDVVQMSPDAERNKQRAVVELPGAEEEETRATEAMVEEEHASDQKKHVATPRLSLLLFFAPDFSGTSMEMYSGPGKAFGGMIHYHLLNRWSISAGVVKNYKQYTGDGEDYQPPTGYWKYYTNGIIPETIDGSCSILEFPVMIQYTVFNSGKNKWVVGAGASSYLMQTESYRYNFDQPNPGAKEGWDSKGSSKFYFNMINFTIGFEHQVLPGLMIGLEPYAKIPLEEIGWSNLKLFSTGASVTLRYTILGRDNASIPARSRAPD